MQQAYLMQQALLKCSRLVLNAALVFDMLRAWYALNAAVALWDSVLRYLNQILKCPWEDRLQST